MNQCRTQGIMVMVRWLLKTGARFSLLLGVMLTGIYGAPLLSLEPANSTVLPGSRVLLTVNATDLSDLYAFQFDLNFAPAVLQASVIEEGALLGRGGTTLFVPGRIDNNTGTVSMTISTLVSAVPGVSGNGPLAQITWQAVGSGTSPVTLSRVILLDSHLSEISTGIAGAQITVAPEPASLALGVAGLASLGALLRRKQSQADGSAPAGDQSK